MLFALSLLQSTSQYFVCSTIILVHYTNRWQTFYFSVLNHKFWMTMVSSIDRSIWHQSIESKTTKLPALMVSSVNCSISISRLLSNNNLETNLESSEFKVFTSPCTPIDCYLLLVSFHFSMYIGRLLPCINRLLYYDSIILMIEFHLSLSLNHV